MYIIFVSSNIRRYEDMKLIMKNKINKKNFKANLLKTMELNDLCIKLKIGYYKTKKIKNPVTQVYKDLVKEKEKKWIMNY